MCRLTGGSSGRRDAARLRPVRLAPDPSRRTRPCRCAATLRPSTGARGWDPGGSLRTCPRNLGGPGRRPWCSTTLASAVPSRWVPSRRGADLAAHAAADLRSPPVSCRPATDVPVRVPPHSMTASTGADSARRGRPPDSARPAAVPHARRLLGDSSSCAGKAERVDSPPPWAHLEALNMQDSRPVRANGHGPGRDRRPSVRTTGPADWATISASTASAATHQTAPGEGGRMPIA